MEKSKDLTNNMKAKTGRAEERSSMRLLKRSLPLWLVLLLLVFTAGLTLAAITPIRVNITLLSYKEVTILETDVQVVSGGFSVTGQDIPANTGTEENPINFSNPYAKASTGAATGDYVYTFYVEETSLDALDIGEKFKVGVHGDGAYIGTIYIGQTAKDDTVIEGVECTVSVGITIKSIDIIITRLA